MTVDSYRFSFIIPVLNGERYLDQCLSHIEAEMFPGDEIIVVDNGSTDNTVNIARQRGGVQVLEHPELTVGGLRNRGAQASTGDVLAFIDADCLLQPGWRQATLGTLEDTSVQATGSKCILPPTPTWVEKAWLMSKAEAAHVVEYLPSANLIIRRSMFDAIGGFDESLVTDEDYEIGVRITRSGGRIIEEPRIASIHLGNSKTVRQFVRRQVWHATSLLESLSRNGWDRAMFMTLGFVASCLLALAGVVISIWSGKVALLALLLIPVIPLLTAAYKVVQNGSLRYLPHLTLLYFLFYIVRSGSMLAALFRAGEKQ